VAASLPFTRARAHTAVSLSLSLCPRSIARAGLSYNTIFEEIPIKISNISLVKAFLAELEDNDFLDRGAEFDRLSDVSSDAFLEKGNAALLISLSLSRFDSSPCKRGTCSHRLSFAHAQA
jgi:hypothetical protein